MKFNNLNNFNNSEIRFNNSEIRCNNCDSLTHTFKQCTKSIKSWGIIALYENTVLLIQRRHTLGFTEFIAGKYNEKNINSIILLFKQMSKQEGKLINTLTFQELWAIVFPRSSNLTQMYKDAYEKFSYVKSNEDINLNFYLSNIIVDNTPEWGFPKGRKHKYESEYKCAIREFIEETNLKETDILINNNNMYTEELTGTDGKLYEHKYYLGKLATSNIPTITENIEIGNIGLFTYEEAIHLIKYYHDKRKDILKKIMKN